jgi:hypothetical protein
MSPDRASGGHGHPLASIDAAEATPRVVVFDTRERSTIASSSPRAGIANPLRFERDVLVYRHWHHTAGEQEMRLTIDATTT